MFQTLMEEESTARKQSWWKRRTQMEKCLMVVIVLMIIIMTSVLITINTKRAVPPQSEKYTASSSELEKNSTVTPSNCINPKEETCDTPSCIKEAAYILESIDESVEPCEDFYSFACGNFIKNAIIADDKTAKTTFTALSDQLQQRLRNVLGEPSKSLESPPIQLVKKYYQACMNKGGVNWASGSKPVSDQRVCANSTVCAVCNLRK